MLAIPLSQRSKKGCGGATIQEGDLVIVYEGYDRIKAVRVVSSGQLENGFGLFKHKDWIGLPFGSQVWASRGNGYVHLLAATPELWTQVLSHRTQILYVADISLVVSMLELRPGSIILESGTGSGSLTTSLSRAVAPTGHVHTFEFHEQRANIAREEFEKNGIGNLITVTQRDIQGLGFPSSLEGQADGVFLDLPGPWNVVPSAARCLRPDSPFCSFSPCIEQVQRTCETLAKNGFTDIRTFETLLRPYEVRREQLLMALPPPPEELAATAPAHLEAADGACRARPPDTNASPAHKRQCTSAHHHTAHTTEQEAQGGEGSGEEPPEEAVPKPGDTTDMPPILTHETPDETRGGDVPEGHPTKLEAEESGGGGENVRGMEKRGRRAMRQVGQGGDVGGAVLAKPAAECKGHTGYLTFARLAS